MPEGSPRPLTPDDWRLRAELYRQFIQGAGPPSHAALGAAAGMKEAEILERLAVLAAHHLITLKGDAGFIGMVHPFSAVPTALPVETPLGLFWANCAWDALGVPGLLGVDSTTRTRCAKSGDDLELGVLGGDVWGEGCVHFWSRPGTRGTTSGTREPPSSSSGRKPMWIAGASGDHCRRVGL